MLIIVYSGSNNRDIDVASSGTAVQEPFVQTLCSDNCGNECRNGGVAWPLALVIDIMNINNVRYGYNWLKFAFCSRDEIILGIPMGPVGPMGFPWEWESLG